MGHEIVLGIETIQTSSPEWVKLLGLELRSPFQAVPHA